MNRELALKLARASAHNSTTDPLVQDGEKVVLFIDEFDKFVELIVKECSDLCTHEGPFTSEVIWGKQFRQRILKHFGVE